ncbi:hypothetical protein [Sagittula sp. SSi028]|uniref:hypothetical protein n=1 Tax=Sagittula sp. SSi028 TaxID=3400636 RepID=UPI003AF7E816
MDVLFSAQAGTAGINALRKGAEGDDALYASRSRTGAATGSYSIAEGKPNGGATGAITQATAITAEPAVVAPGSNAQVGQAAASLIALEARDARLEAEQADADIAEEQAEQIAASSEPRGTEQSGIAFRENRAEIAESDAGSDLGVAETAEADLLRIAAEEGYRDANETTAGAEPAQLLMDA